MREILEHIAREAGKIILKIYDSDFAVTHKEDKTPLTEADMQANTYIMQELKKEFPEVPIISEEIKNQPYTVRKEWTEFFIIDPIDGTKEFVKRTGDFTVNIAFLSKEKKASIVYVPTTDTMYSSDGEKSYKNGNIIYTREHPETIIAVASISSFTEETREFIESLGKPYTIEHFGSSLKICAVAEGKADLYPRLAPTMEWDTAAAQLILECAGGELVDFESEQALEYNKEDLYNPFFIARRKEILNP